MIAKISHKIINIDLIDTASFNPPTRTTEQALKSFVEEIKAEGIRADVHVIPDGKHYALADGHRRVAAAKMLGYTSISATVHDDRSVDDLAVLWAKLNSKIRRLSAYEWTYAWFFADKSFEKGMPPNLKNQIQSCMRIWGGRSAIKMLLDLHMGPGVAKQIMQLQLRFSEVPSIPKITDKTIGDWVLKHKAQASLQAVFSMKVPAGVLVKIQRRIRKDKPLELYDLAPKKRKIVMV